MRVIAGLEMRSGMQNKKENWLWTPVHKKCNSPAEKQHGKWYCPTCARFLKEKDLK